MIRRKLVWHLFPSFVLVALVALVPVAMVASEALRRSYLNQTEERLRELGHLVSQQIQPLLSDTVDTEGIDRLCKQLRKTGPDPVRFTVISPSGKVWGDSEGDVPHMDDHSNRPEIQQALTEGYGSRLKRKSPTLGISMMYVAQLLREGDRPVAVIRTAIATNALDQTLHAIYTKIVWSGLAIALCAAALSLIIARRISGPIVGMQQIAHGFAQGQLDLRVPIPNSTELQSLARALNEMARQLQERIATITKQRNEVEAILSSMVEGVLAVNQDGRLTNANRAAATLLSIAPETCKGRNVAEVVRDVHLQEFVRDVLAGQQSTEVNLSLPINGGRFFQLHGARLPETPSHPGGAVIVLHDMTRIFRLENVRRDFVANVSHELKTPVTSIKGFVEALLDDQDADAAQVRHYLGIVAKHTDRLNAIIDDLLSLSRLEEDRDQRRISFEETDLQQVLESALELSGIKARQKDIEVILDCPEAGMMAKVNGPLLEQALVNLIDNAVKYSDNQTRVLVTLRDNLDQIEISVEDHGSGIAREHLDRLFERFYVVDKGRSRRLGGTGLGLAIVKHIVQVHGGVVTVESEVGQGSIFTLRLPKE